MGENFCSKRKILLLISNLLFLKKGIYTYIKKEEMFLLNFSKYKRSIFVQNHASHFPSQKMKRLKTKYGHCFLKKKKSNKKKSLFSHLEKVRKFFTIDLLVL